MHVINETKNYGLSQPTTGQFWLLRHYLSLIASQIYERFFFIYISTIYVCDTREVSYKSIKSIYNMTPVYNYSHKRAAEALFLLLDDTKKDDKPK